MESDAGQSSAIGERNLRVLIAEDNPVNQKIAARILERLGYHPHVAENGREALEALEKQPYDVVLMDMQMPEMDGLEASRQIRACYSKEARPYIVALTANSRPEERDQCIEAGMDEFITKPFTAHGIGELLARCSRKR